MINFNLRCTISEWNISYSAIQMMSEYIDSAEHLKCWVISDIIWIDEYEK